jgi:hypothetical protein
MCKCGSSDEFISCDCGAVYCSMKCAVGDISNHVNDSHTGKFLEAVLRYKLISYIRTNKLYYITPKSMFLLYDHTTDTINIDDNIAIKHSNKKSPALITIRYNSRNIRLGLVLDSKIRTTCVCGKPGIKKCGKCKYERYCSTTCQRLDWNYHKKYCSRIGEFGYYDIVAKELENKKNEIYEWLLSKVDDVNNVMIISKDLSMTNLSFTTNKTKILNIVRDNLPGIKFYVEKHNVDLDFNI